MGKKSREKKERRMNASNGIVSTKRPTARAPLDDPKFQTGNGGFLMVIDGNGRVMGFEEARKEYWREVCEAIRGDDPRMLPAMANMGRLMNLSIFDVRVPIFEAGTDSQKTEETILPLALFQMDYVECFRWVFGTFMDDASSWSDEANATANALFNAVFWNSPSLPAGSPKERMAKFVAKKIIEKNHEMEGGLVKVQTINANTLLKAEQMAFAAELAAMSERAALEAAAPGQKTASVGVVGSSEQACNEPFELAESQVSTAVRL